MMLRIRRPNGDALILDCDDPQEAVSEIRERLAVKFDVPSWCVQLFEDAEMLEDEIMVSQITSDEIGLVIRGLAGYYEYRYRWCAGSKTFECVVKITLSSNRQLRIEATGFDEKKSYFEGNHEGMWEPTASESVHFCLSSERQEWELTEEGHLELVQGSIAKSKYRGGLWYGGLTLRQQEPVFWNRGCCPVTAKLCH
eukprot:TRINITY_DN49811_c0_g1_i1.p1 TRINITY_DN49811_c0_g1~~TRINITY_DN49811_c0_g1_i1.p1  ORF type:complete len:197 (-),score=37.69 TRINITY_DN49811_c0_g1_i1:207-797(-)